MAWLSIQRVQRNHLWSPNLPPPRVSDCPLGRGPGNPITCKNLGLWAPLRSWHGWGAVTSTVRAALGPPPSTVKGPAWGRCGPWRGQELARTLPQQRATFLTSCKARWEMTICPGHCFKHQEAAGTPRLYTRSFKKIQNTDNFKVPKCLATGPKKQGCLALPPATYKRDQGRSSFCPCLVPKTPMFARTFWTSGQPFMLFCRSVSPVFLGAQKGARMSMHKPASSSSRFILLVPSVTGRSHLNEHKH